MQVGETEPFICELLTNLTGIIQDLETHQIHMFYETVGLMISAETVPEKRDEYVVRTLAPSSLLSGMPSGRTISDFAALERVASMTCRGELFSCCWNLIQNFSLGLRP